jgi:predicted ATPase
MVGRPEVARERMARMLAAVKSDNPHDLAIAGLCSAALLSFLGEHKKAEPLAARALELSEKNQFPPEAAYSQVVLGQARAHLGSTSEGIALIRRGIASEFEVGARVSIPFDTTSLATAQMLDGKIVQALETVEQALQVNPDQLYSRPEAIRVRGELRLRQNQIELAGVDFYEAIGIARKIGAKAWELRSKMSLARLLAKQDRKSDARKMLAEIYNWFTEGFDTADLKDAKTLLDELSA